MDENNQAPLPPAGQQQQLMASVKCQECAKDVMFPVPTPRVVNFPDMSLVSFVHERFVKCPECGTPHLFMVAGLSPQLQILGQFVKINTPSSIVEGNDQNMKKVLSMNSLVSKVKQ